ncbi:hypothetical protein Lser_V15G40640 [Lactuca serriola]
MSELQSDKSNLGVKVADLTKDKELKSKKISDLQNHFNLLTSSYVALKKKLEEDFGDTYLDLPIGQSSGVVSHANDEPPQAPHVSATILNAQEEAVEKGQLFFKRNSNQNASWDEPSITTNDLEVVHFRDTFGDRSGIASWGFHDPLKMWIVMQKSGNSELYRDSHIFSSLTRVDLTELSRAPFSNLTNNPQVTQFKHFLEDQVKTAFLSIQTAQFVIFEHPDILDPKTDKPLQVVMWPATKQVKQFPVLQS